MTATPQQHVPLTGFGTSVTSAVTATIAGRLLTMVVQAQIAQDIVSITDSASNTWAKAASTFPSSQKHSAIWYCLTAASINSVTINGHATTSMNINGNFVEWAGSSGYVLRGGNAVANGSSTTPPVCAATAQSGDLVVSGLSYLEAVSGTRQDTLATGTLLDPLARGTTAMSGAYKIAASTGTDGCTWTFSPADSSGASTANFGPPAANVPPTANAGPDQSTVEPYATVQLDGSGSADSDGTIASYAWTQTAGPTVTLSSTSVQKPTFPAPATLAGTSLTFSLTVTDNNGATSSADTVTITVFPHTTWRIDSGGPTSVQVSRL